MNRHVPWLLTVALVVLGGVARLWVADPAPGAFDEVGFQAALTRWDLLAFEPHFPGYPLAVLLARAAAALGASAPYAAAATALLLPASLALLRAANGGAGGVLAGGLLALAPLAVLEGARPMSDAIGTQLLALGAAACVVRRAGLGGLLLGCAAAAKPDLLLFAPAAALAARDRAALARAALGLGLPLLLTLPALSAGAGGPAPLAAEATRFLTGHLTEWGGGVATSTTPGLRLARAASPLTGSLGLSGLGHLPAALLLLLLALQAPQRLRRAAVVSCVPYGLWLLLGQNLAHPRHALPLLVPLALLVGRGLTRIPTPSARRLLCGALLLGACLGSAAALRARAHEGRTADRLVAWLATEDPLETRLYAGRLGRVVEARLVDHDVRRARSLSHLTDDLLAEPVPPLRVVVTSEVPGSTGLPLVLDLGTIKLYRAR